MRAQKHVVLPQEDAAEFAALEAAIRADLAPIGALQSLLARRESELTARVLADLEGRAPPGASSAPIASRPRCWRSAATRAPTRASP